MTRHARALERALLGLSLIVVAYHALDVFWSINSAMPHYVVHLGMVLVVVALKTAAVGTAMQSARGRHLWLALGYGTAAIAVIAAVYLHSHNQALEIAQPFLTNWQMTVGIALVAVVLALNWVVWGAALTIVCLAAALYFAFGHLVPGLMRDLELDPGVLVSNLAGMGSPRGLFMYMPLSADTILLLLVYGGLMSSTKVLDMFGELGNAIGNYLRGGVAYSCVAASSLIGMVTGQTVSCIALTGSMTIPTMVRGGFRKEEAGAIEVLSANGSQLIPPIMGLGAFLMAVITGIPYVEIAKAAIVPALLYVTTLVIGVSMAIHHFRDIGFSRHTVSWRRFMWILPSFLPSIGAVVVLLYLRYSANLAALVGIAVLVTASFLRPRALRPSWRDLAQGLKDGVIAAAQLGLILAAIGIIVQVLLTSGLGNEFSSFMVKVSGQSMLIALLAGMAIALIIGMGLPTPAAYSLCTIVMIPPLIDVGVPALAAHFFGFYFAVLSAITPPVAVGILMAVRISGGSFAGTAIAAMKLCGVCLLLPFFIVAFPNSLEFPNLTAQTLFAAFVLCIGTVALGAAAYGSLVGRLTPALRTLMAADFGLVMIYFQVKQAWIGACAVAIVVLTIAYRHLRVRPKASRVAEPSH
jgi:TRAP transporter 4TM/12TM fusion protein